MDPNDGEITGLVSRWSEGDESAFDELMARVYPDLKRLAHHHLSLGRRDGTMDTTVLVHEAYIRIVGASHGDWRGRAQFFAYCSKAMRHILVDFARRKKALKRDGERASVTLDEGMAVVDRQSDEILAVNEVLERLAERNPRMSQIVECRFFGGMSVPETAEATGASERTVEREWARARAYLKRGLSDL